MSCDDSGKRAGIVASDPSSYAVRIVLWHLLANFWWRMAREKEVGLRVILNNKKPVELVDIGQSFKALGELYESFAHESGIETQPGNSKLYLVGVSKGSIVADLKAILDQASFVVDHLEVLAGFMTHITELIEFFRVQRPIKDRSGAPTRADAERIAKFVEPVAKDGASQFNINFQGDGHNVSITHINFNSERANAIQNNVRRFLGPQIPEFGTFEKEVLYLEQMRRGNASSVGDRGVIERFSVRPVKLLFMSDEVKAEIIDKPQNPFQMSYIVDGIVSTAHGEPALYKIMKVHEAIGPSRSRRAGRKKRGKAAA